MNRITRIVTAAAAGALAIGVLAGCTATGGNGTVARAPKPAATASSAPVVEATKAPVVQPAAPAALNVGDVTHTWTDKIPANTVLFDEGNSTYEVIPATGPLPAKVAAAVTAKLKAVYSGTSVAAITSAVQGEETNTGRTLVLYGYVPPSTGAVPGYRVMEDNAAPIEESSMAAAQSEATKLATQLGSAAAAVAIS